MKRFWRWMRDNSTVLQGVASAVIIVAALAALPGYLESLLRPDLEVRLNIDESTLPSDLMTLLDGLSNTYKWDEDALNTLKSASERRGVVIDISTLEGLRSSNLKLDKAHLEILNQSGSVLSGVRIRLENVYSLWGFDVTGTYLRPAEAETFLAKLDHVDDQNLIVSPELPPLPPNSSIAITVYGNLSRLKPIISTSGHSFEVTEIVEVESGTLIEWYQQPSRLIGLLFLVLVPAYLIFALLWMRVRTRVVINAEKNILYDKACKLAVSGEKEKAMVLLREAVNAGYINFQHALGDEDLKSLREREDFVELLKKS